MKTLKTIILGLLFPVLCIAQVPQGIKHQVVVRDAYGIPLENQSLSLRISLLEDSATGTAAYVETHAVTSNALGLVNLNIGQGSPANGSFAALAWHSHAYHAKVEVDTAGGSNYALLGISQLLTVPYAFHAGSANMPTMTQSQRDAIQHPAQGMEIFNLSSNCVNLYINNHWREMSCAPWLCGDYLTAVVEVTNPTTGKIWMDRNLGATQAATSSTDTNAYGDLFQWGRFADGHQCRNSATTTALSSTNQPGHASFILQPNSPWDWLSPQDANLWQGLNGVNNPCPAGYRLPTEAELNLEKQSWSSNNSAGAYGSPLKLPLAGIRDYSDGSLLGVGSCGYYWSSTVSGTYSSHLSFYSSAASMGSYYRAYGSSVRCIKD